MQLAVLGVLVLASFCVFAVDAIDAALHDRVFIGADGTWAYDQLQYLGWSTDAAHHGLVANLFALHVGAHVFLHPLWLVMGLLHGPLGLSYSLLIAVWQAIALVLLFAAVRRYAGSLLGASAERGDEREGERDGEPGGERRVTVALVLALFMLPVSFLVANRLNLVGAKLTNFETLSVGWVSDDFQLALAVAAMIVFLLAVRALLARPASGWGGRPALVAAAAGVAAAWLHPWQGILVLLIAALLVAWERPAWARHRVLVAPLVATALPVAYYGLLPHLDGGWAQSSNATAYSFTSYIPSLLLTLGPVALMMAPGYALPSADAGERMLKLWPVASLILFVLSPSDAMHAIGGFAVPAAVLMVRGWPWLAGRLPGGARRHAGRLAAAAVVFTVLSAPISVMHRMTEYRSGDQAFAEIVRGDAAALDWLAARPQRSGVLSSAALGAWVPAVTDDRSWIGHPVWTPDYDARSRQVSALFSGSEDGRPAQERAFVVATGAGVVLEPCGAAARLGPALGRAGFGVRRVGCATLYLQTSNRKGLRG